MAAKGITTGIDALIAAEKGTVFKKPGGKVSICLVYPNIYHIGMSNLGFQGVYTVLNDRPDTVCERAFLPDEEDMTEYLRTRNEIVSMESKRPLHRFDIIAFSVSFENDYPNILRILELSRVPLRARERRDVHPLVIMGGVCAFFNPEPVADFLDICFIGEAEGMLPEFVEAYIVSKNREDLFEKVMKIEGIYVPGYYEIRYGDDGRIAERIARGNAPENIKRRFVSNIGEYHFRPSIITTETEFSRMYLTEAMRGCPWNCRFCVAGYVYKPVRRKGLGMIKEEIKNASSLSSKVGLIAPSLTDYPHTADVLRMDGVDFSITSLRANRKSAELVGFLHGHKSVSIAPEAGTERLRTAIDKRITEEDILETSQLILSGGIEILRLYFMVGLPTEGETDIQGIVSLVEEIRRTSPKGTIVLTLSTFVPKPFTPFQWHPMERIEVVKDRIRTVKTGLSALKRVKVFHDVPKYAYMQGLFSRGDRRTSGILVHMLDAQDWREACKRSGIDADTSLFRQREFHDILPWDFIDNSILKEKLWTEYQKALGKI